MTLLTKKSKKSAFVLKKSINFQNLINIHTKPKIIIKKYTIFTETD